MADRIAELYVEAVHVVSGVPPSAPAAVAATAEASLPSPPASLQPRESERFATDVRGSVSHMLLTGFEAVDVEMFVACRALQRVSRRAGGKQDPVVESDLRVVEEALGRIAKTIRNNGVGLNAALRMQSFPSTDRLAASASAVGGYPPGSIALGASAAASSSTSILKPSSSLIPAASSDVSPSRRHRASNTTGTASFAPTSPLDGDARSPRRAVTLDASMALGSSFSLGGAGRPSPSGRRGFISRRDTEIEGLARRARVGLWGVVQDLAARSQGSFELRLHADVSAAQREELLEQARVAGLGNLGTRLRTCARPCVGVHVVDMPSATAPTSSMHLGPIAPPFSPGGRAGAPAVDPLWGLPTGLVDRARALGLPVKGSASSCWGASKVDNIPEKRMASFSTASLQGSFITIDFCNAYVLPRGYGFHSIHHIIPGNFPRSWKLLGSSDGDRWELLAEVVDDRQLCVEKQWGTWKIAPLRATASDGNASDELSKSTKANNTTVNPVSGILSPNALSSSFSSSPLGVPGSFRLSPSVRGTVSNESPTAGIGATLSPTHQQQQQQQSAAGGATKPAIMPFTRGYRFLRLEQTAPNSFGSHELQAHGFEVYGTLVFVEGTAPLPLRGCKATPARQAPLAKSSMDLDTIKKRTGVATTGKRKGQQSTTT